ncbi:MAG TPA: hypothetical protein VK474_13600 [Chthoniobacterales bacterium]|nr:hypothetical protein [Chthoniobacterales bacterium]
MPRYNIELRTISHVATTLEVDRDDLTELRVEVARFVGELLKDHAAQIWTDEDWQVEATDQTGLILFTMNVFASDTAATMMPRRRS